MIKVGITGGETSAAGELLRLLINHPEVEILSIHSPQNAGKPIASVHHGFIGEQRLLFTSNFDTSSMDIVFLVEPWHTSAEWRTIMSENPHLKLILYAQALSIAEALECEPIFGLSEMNRKGLVRGGRASVLPACVSSVAMIALYPLASHLMIPPILRLKVSMPGGMVNEELATAVNKELKNNITIAQSSFMGEIPIEYVDSGRKRGMAVEFEMEGQTQIEEIIKIYESVYDDHNFTFMVPVDVDYNEVEGTHKCVISIQRKEDRIYIRAVADSTMRGGASEAVHIMNLMMGLYEKTGLSLKTL